jgi:tetratricopeptide (TPR) repeat protein
VRRAGWGAGIALLVLSWTASAQTPQGDLARAFELERNGRYREAAARYHEALTENPANLSALLGLERVLSPLEELDSLPPLVDSAVVLQPSNRSLRALQLRVLGAVEQRAALDSAAMAWITAMPSDAEPYSEWAKAVAALGDEAGARAILAQGGQRVGSEQLAQDQAELSVLAGRWTDGAQQWRAAVEANRALLSAATSSLESAPAGMRDRVTGQLYSGQRGDSVGGRLAADLLLAWDRPLEAWAILSRVMPSENQVAVSMLRRFADRARLVRAPDGARARGYALEAMAERSDGAAAERFRVEAARAFAEAGDRNAAERMLERVSVNARGGEATATQAIVTLIGVMAESDRTDDAERRLREWADRLPPNDAADLRVRIAWSWIRRGNLERARGLLETDSTVASMAVRGWVALYQGDLRTATEFFRRAGPATGTRQQATERTAMTALIQRIEPDSVPALGEALLKLARGDTTDAVSRLERVAGGLPARGGRSDLLAFAGRLSVEMREGERGETLLRAAMAADSTGPSAPQALYQLARALSLQGETGEAQNRLEHLILHYPKSALLPLARRLLDQLRGRVPG